MAPRLDSWPLLLLWTVSCGGGDVETTHLVLTQGACELPQLGHVHSVQATLQPPGQPLDCLPLEPKTLDALQSGLSGKFAFRGLNAGAYNLILRGFEDKACKGTVLVCGDISFQLPVAADTVTIPVDCHGGPAQPPPDFASCVAK
jgi:hypothetical protein